MCVRSYSPVRAVQQQSKKARCDSLLEQDIESIGKRLLNVQIEVPCRVMGYPVITRTHVKDIIEIPSGPQRFRANAYMQWSE